MFIVYIFYNLAYESLEMNFNISKYAEQNILCLDQVSLVFE